MLEGTLEVQEKDEVVTLPSSELCVVRRDREHRVLAQGHASLILSEPAGIAPTRNVRAEITGDQHDWLE
jgi:hypothetical protein